MSAPLVAIVGRLADEAKGVRGVAFAAGRHYSYAIERAGGIPLILPPILALVDRIDSLLARVNALVLHGGGDVDPRHYGQQVSADQVYGIVAEHDEVELAVARAALDLDVPTLAICRGMQVLNVVMGGTLAQHIGEDHWFHYTTCRLDSDSLVAKAMGTDSPAACHCVHHQALGTVAPGLRITGSHVDGTVHAAEVPGRRWFVATQWHPEDSAADDAQQQGLFDELVRQAG